MKIEVSDLMPPVSVVIRPMARKISLRLDHAVREAQLILPHRRYLRQGRKLLHQKSEWLSQQWLSLPPALPFIPDRHILLCGQKVLLVFEQGRGSYRRSNDALVVPALREELFASRVRRALIALARQRLEECVALYAKRIDVTYGKITMRDTKSRWGSCSAAGNLNFSWRLICAPDFVLSYVAAHEVVHIREANHGQEFWEEVRRCFGDPAPARKYLRTYAPKLFAVGVKQ